MLAMRIPIVSRQLANGHMIIQLLVGFSYLALICYCIIAHHHIPMVLWLVMLSLAMWLPYSIAVRYRAYLKFSDSSLECVYIWHRWSIPLSEIRSVSANKQWSSFRGNIQMTLFNGSVKRLQTARPEEFFAAIAEHEPRIQIN